MIDNQLCVLCIDVVLQGIEVDEMIFVVRQEDGVEFYMISDENVVVMFGFDKEVKLVLVFLKNVLDKCLVFSK